MIELPPTSYILALFRWIERQTDEKQAALGKRLGVSQVTISRWQRGVHIMSYENARSIIQEARKLGWIEQGEPPLVGRIDGDGLVHWLGDWRP